MRASARRLGHCNRRFLAYGGVEAMIGVALGVDSFVALLLYTGGVAVLYHLR